ncbi:tRNA (adenosine(37)-N6)-dimethylallyltransferase MiaA [Aureimonas mangrovi]|uniref:tRNA (adenosine(37)-N6)-dimethylallyltransferase MiaA n=1 Tax=Aureimonas mangrovi TaxID=2758041 RepID=UPI00163DD620|nr:tRNA (adenosine(37)-N6)-dimethylallyltransferase MiaA [Aureimonas mangrovi]
MKNAVGPSAILIAGPTASGKSALAVELARAFGGEVVNADSMQVYDGLRILSARPEPSDMGGVLHHLYGHRDPAAPYSAGDWSREVAALLPEITSRGAIPVFCGGTGLYFTALEGGLGDKPVVPEAARTFWRARMAQEGPARLHAVLAERDPEAASRIRASDPQRITRALELSEAVTPPGSLTTKALIPAGRVRRIVIAPPRDLLRERIAARFDAMLAAGAMEEALAFAARPGAMDGLAAKAIGLTELVAAQAGKVTPEAARAAAITRTRQYAKRQETWFRNQFGPEWQRIESAEAALLEL